MDKLEFLSRDAAPPAYEIRDLGLLDDGRLCHASGINEHGVIVGDADTTLGVHAIRWQRGLLDDLGTLGGTYSAAIDVNDDGHIVGVSELVPAGKRVSFLHVDGKLIDLSGLGVTGPGVRAINNDGWIVGEMPFGPDRPVGAFLWQGGNITDIVGPYVDGSSAEAINNAGQIVGHLSSLQQFDQAFFWNQGRVVDLGLGRAYSVNDHGLVVGMTYQGGGQDLACMWSNFQRRELVLPSDCASSTALAVNNAEEIVGTMSTHTGIKKAFLWKREYMMDINDLVDTALGWKLQEARAINDTGQIVGWGFLGHRHHGFVMTPSERRDALGKRLPLPHAGAEEVAVPDIAEEREANESFEDMILRMVQNEGKPR